MKELFQKIALKNIINFLKTVGLLLKNIDCYQHLRPSNLYKQKALTFIYTHTYISEFNTQWPLRGQFAIKPNHHQPKHLHLQIIYIVYVCEKAPALNNL